MTRRSRQTGGERKLACPRTRWGMWRWRRAFAKVGRKQQLDHTLRTLKAISELDVAPRRSFWLLQQVHQRARPLIDELRHKLNGQGLPLPRQTQATLQRYLQALERLASCYQLVAEMEAKRGLRSPERAARAAQTSLALRGEALLGCAKVYAAPPPAFWRDVHSVYRTARRGGVAERPVKPVGPDGELKRQSPGGTYRCILAFAVAQSESVRRSQIEPVFTRLAGWVNEATLSRELPSWQPSQPLIWVDINSDRPPELHAVNQHCRRMVNLGEGEHFMGLQQVIAGLEALEPGNEEEKVIGRPDTLRMATVEHLLHRFSTSHGRRSERMPARARVDVQFGLDDIQSTLSYVVADEANGATAAYQREQGRSAAAKLTLQTIATPVDAPANLSTPSRPAAGHGIPGITVPPPRERTESGQTQPTTAGSTGDAAYWTLVDESAEGLRLNWNCDRPSRASVGQLIAYRVDTESGETSPWCLATVRWMRFHDWNVFQVGAQKVAGRPYPAVVRRQPRDPNRKRKRDQEPTDPALLLDGGDAEETSVILPPFLYDRGEIVEIDVADRTLRVELDTIHERSANFVRFGVRTAPARRRHEITEDVDEITIWGETEGNSR